MLHTLIPTFSFLHFLAWLLKLPLDQNSILIYHEFNDNFKSHKATSKKKSEQKCIVFLILYGVISYNQIYYTY
jgi:hypothetical protein